MRCLINPHTYFLPLYSHQLIFYDTWQVTDADKRMNPLFWILGFWKQSGRQSGNLDVNLGYFFVENLALAEVCAV